MLQRWPLAQIGKHFEHYDEPESELMPRSILSPSFLHLEPQKIAAQGRQQNNGQGKEHTIFGTPHATDHSLTLSYLDMTQLSLLNTTFATDARN